MKICPECHVLVGGPEHNCPLCGTALQPSDIQANDESLYPKFAQAKKQRSRFPLLAKIFAFLSIITILICGTVNLIVDHRFTWSLFVIGAIICLWTSLGFHLLTNVNLNNKLLMDLLSLSAYLVLVDKLTGWTRWSINYVTRPGARSLPQRPNQTHKPTKQLINK